MLNWTSVMMRIITNRMTDPGRRCAEAVVEEGVPVNGVYDEVGGVAGAALGENLDLAEGLEGLNNVDDYLEEQRGGQSRQRHVEKLAPVARAVDGRAFIQLRGMPRARR